MAAQSLPKSPLDSGHRCPVLVVAFGCDEYLGGFVCAGIFGVPFIQQATLCVNSLGSWSMSSPLAALQRSLAIDHRRGCGREAEIKK